MRKIVDSYPLKVILHPVGMLSIQLFTTPILETIFRQNATHCISPYAIVTCVCVCVCVCVYAAFVDHRKTV